MRSALRGSGGGGFTGDDSSAPQVNRRRCGPATERHDASSTEFSDNHFLVGSSERRVIKTPEGPRKALGRVPQGQVSIVRASGRAFTMEDSKT